MKIQIDYNILTAFYMLFQYPQCVLWFLLLEVIYAGCVLYICIRPKAEMGNVKMLKVTDCIEIPIAAGNGQHGQERFATEKEKDTYFANFDYSGVEQLKKAGIVVEMRKEGNTEKIRFVDGPKSTIIIGATRAGKTRRVLLESLWLQLLAGYSVVISDVKGEIFYYTSEWAKDIGYNVIPLDLRNPQKSYHYNFLQQIIDALKQGDQALAVDATWDLVSVLVGEQKGEPLWYNGETATLAASILAVCMESGTEDFKRRVDKFVNRYFESVKGVWLDNFSEDEEGEHYSEAERHNIQNEIWEMTSNLLCGYADPYFVSLEREQEVNNAEAEKLLLELKELMSEDNTVFKNMSNVYYFLAYMAREDPVTGATPLSLYLDTLPDFHPAKIVFMQGQVASERTRSSFYTSALGTLRLFTNPKIAEMTSKSDFVLSDVGGKKTVIYMIIPDEKKTLYPLASILVQQIYMSQVKVANENGGRLPYPCDYDLDEVGNFPVIPVLAPMITAGQSRGCRVNLVIQDYQQLEKKYKDDYETIKSNCTVKIYLKTDSAKTLKEISDYLGNYTVEITNASATSNTNKFNEGSVSAGRNLGGRPLLMPAEISHISAPYALVMNQGTYSAITELPDLSKYKINQIWGLGDEKHNVALIAEREKLRPERENMQRPQLWGIWNKFKEQLEEISESSSTSFLG